MKINIFALLSFLFFSTTMDAQQHKKSVVKFQKELNKEFKNPKKSPLKKEDLKTFQGLAFFPIDEKYRVTAKFERAENAIPFQMTTTTDRLPTYEVYGTATFVIDQQEFTLNIYQSHQLRATKKYKTHLFLPFTDLTNGTETYGGGRFLDLEIPEEGTSIPIDFNKAYHPYCAYNYSYSCPIPPEENDLKIKIEAGVKL